MDNKEIISLLPTGSQTRIAESFGVSRQAVNKALNGQMKGAAAGKIIEAATLLAEAALRKRQAAILRMKLARMSDDELLKWAKPLLK